MLTNNNISKLFLFYAISNFLLLLNFAGIYGDDYFLHYESSQRTLDLFSQYGMPYFGYFHLFFQSIGNGVFLYRFITFSVYFLSGIFLYFALLNIRFVPKEYSFYIALFFMIFPVNSARMEVITLPYGICYCLFFLAFMLLTKFLQTQSSTALRIFILILFFCSFFTNSLLVFYVIPMGYLCYEILHRTSPKRTICFFSILIFQYLDFLILPILFFIVKQCFFHTYGSALGYNSIHLDDISSNLFNLIKSAFIKPVADLFFVAELHVFYLIFISISCFIYMKNKIPFNNSALPCSLFLGLGFFALLLAVFPYAAVGKTPDPGSFESRHMLLEPLGFSLIICGFLMFIEKLDKIIFQAVFLVLVSLCLLKNINVQSSFLKDWFYQVALLENYKSNKLIKGNSTFIFDSKIVWANRRPIETPEHNAMLYSIFADRTRLMVKDREELTNDRSYCWNDSYGYFCSKWYYSQPYYVHINMLDNLSSVVTFSKFLYLMIFNQGLFHQEANKLVKVNVIAATTGLALEVVEAINTELRSS